MVRIGIKKLNKKKASLALFLLLVIIIGIIIFLRRPKDYTLIYNVNDIEVKEVYFKENKYYAFSLNNDLVYSIELKFQQQKKLITNIEKFEVGNEICLKLEGKVETILCHNGKEQIDSLLVGNEMKSLIGISYNENQSGIMEKISLYNLDNYNYFIWNYNQLYMINSKETKAISLFDSEQYGLKLSYITKDYFVVADYDQEHIFKKLYLINNKTGKVDEWNLNDEFYFDGYFLGTHKNSLYFVDRKRKIEVEFDLKKRRYRTIAKSNEKGKIYNDGFEKISMSDLLNNTMSFSETTLYNYDVISNKLYLKYLDSDKKILVSNYDIKSIISILHDTVFYLVDDKLYSYNQTRGEQLVMQYFEWNFNDQNIIFIYEPK